MQRFIYFCYELGIKEHFSFNANKGFTRFISNTLAQHQYNLAMFTIDVEQEIIAFEDSLGRDIFINAGQSARQGIGLSLASQISESLSSSLAYSYSDFTYKTFIDKKGNDFLATSYRAYPKIRFMLPSTIKIKKSNGLHISLEALYLDQFALNNDNTESMELSLVTNIRGGYRMAIETLRIEPFIGISNLFNQVYSANARINAFSGRFYESGPKRNLYAGVSIRHNFTRK